MRILKRYYTAFTVAVVAVITLAGWQNTVYAKGGEGQDNDDSTVVVQEFDDNNLNTLYAGRTGAKDGSSVTVPIFYSEDYERQNGIYIRGNTGNLKMTFADGSVEVINFPIKQEKIDIGDGRIQTKFTGDSDYFAALAQKDPVLYAHMENMLTGGGGEFYEGGKVQATENYALTYNNGQWWSSYSMYTDASDKTSWSTFSTWNMLTGGTDFTGNRQILFDDPLSSGAGKLSLLDVGFKYEQLLNKYTEFQATYTGDDKIQKLMELGKDMNAYQDILNRFIDKGSIDNLLNKDRGQSLNDFMNLIRDIAKSDGFLKLNPDGGFNNIDQLSLAKLLENPNGSEFLKNIALAQGLWKNVYGDTKDFFKYGGILADFTNKFSKQLMESWGFRNPEDAFEHIDYVLYHGKKMKLEEFIEQHKDDPDGLPTDIEIIEKGDPYEPPYKTEDDDSSDIDKVYHASGWIHRTVTDLRDRKHQHRIGQKGNIFNIENPKYYTYNDSVEYNDEEGDHIGFADEIGMPDSDQNGEGIIIPSSEKYLNGITAYTNYGYASLGLGCQRAVYECAYSYQYQQKITGWFHEEQEFTTQGPPDPVTGEPTTQTTYVTVIVEREKDGALWMMDWHSHDGVIATVHRDAYYLYLEDLDVKDFDGMTTYNDTFTNDTQTYNATNDKHVLRDIQYGTGNGNGGEGRVTGTVPGTIDGRPNGTYKAHVAYTDFEGTIKSTKLNSAQGARSSAFIPKGSSHLTWDVDPSDEGWGNWDLGTYNVYQEAAKYDRWDGGTVTDEPPGPSGEVQAAALARANYDVGDMKNTSTKTAGHGQEWHLAKVTSTDALSMPDQNYGEMVIMPEGSSAEVSYKGTSEAWDSDFSVNPPKYLGGLMGQILSNGKKFQDTKEQRIETYESTPALNLEQQHIPREQANGRYPTAINETKYKAVLISKKKQNRSFSGANPVDGSIIKPSYNHNEPIIIQTPVVSPITVRFDDGEEEGSSYGDLCEAGTGDGHQPNQLKEEKSDVRQFRLDECYWFEFDPLQHLITQGYSDIDSGIPFDNTWSKNDIKFDKYVESKKVHFPFDVCIYTSDGGTDGTPEYHKHTDDENDEDYWIDVTEGTLGDMKYNKFYIPAWAHEDYYGDDNPIRYRVEAINVTNAGGDAEQEEKNEYGDAKEPNHEKYIATYQIKCQLSGWAYNFQVVGTNLRDLYDPNLTQVQADTWHDLYVPFCPLNEEKKAGKFNRLGNDFKQRYDWARKWVRYTSDGVTAEGVPHDGGEVTDEWNDKDTIIIAAHSSHKYENPGVAPAGTELAYSFQTMGNFWNDGDWAEIHPTFRYYDPSGTVYEIDPNSGKPNQEDRSKLHLYYDDIETGTGKKRLVEYGSNTDKNNMRKITLADQMFRGSYTDFDARHTGAHPTPNYRDSGDIENFNKPGGSDSTTNAFLNKKVKNYCLDFIEIKSGLRIFTGDEGQLKSGLKLNGQGNDKEYNDVEELYSNFPEDTAGPTGNGTNTNELMKHAVQTWYGEYWIPDNLYLTTYTREDLQHYAEEHGGLDKDSEPFLHGGYLVLHFDIIVHNTKDPEQDIVYSGDGWGGSGGSNGFKNEKSGEHGDNDNNYNITVGDPAARGNYSEKTISVQYGDVIIINPDTNLSDWWKAAYWTIN